MEQRLDGNKIPSTEDLKKAGSPASVVAQGNPGDVPVLNAPDLFCNDEGTNNLNVEKKTQCTISKTKLDFGLSGQTLQVTQWGQLEPFVSETITLINNSQSRDYLWQVVQSVPNEKYKVEAFPSSGKVKSKRTTPITIKFRIFCTTKLNIKLGIMLAPKIKTFFGRSNNNKSKGNITTTQDVLMLSFRADSDLSASIDYDELVIENRIASGGFGTVYKAQWRGLDVAVKKLHVQDLTPEDKEVFLREIKLMKMLNCQYVVTLMGSTQIPGQPVCLVMEYIQKGALTNLLKNPISTRLKCKIILDVARGMNFMHKNNIFHRDLKPDNVLVISESEDAFVNIKITDFDTARTYLQDSDDYRQNYQSFVQAAKSAQQEIRSLSNMGTLIYKAPELMGGGKVDPNLIDKTDVFSFAILAFQVFSQVEPFSEVPYNKWTTREIETFVKTENRLPIPSTVPKPVSDLIERCWQHKPRARPGMESIVGDLQQILPKFDRRDSNPLPPSPTGSKVMVHRKSISDASPTVLEFIPPVQHHSLIGWAGVIERDTAVQKLEHCPRGTFLIRWSSRAQSYVMTLKGTKGVEHIADIRPNPETGGITVVKQNGDKRHFANLVEYIDAMKRQQVISTPLPPEQEQEDVNYERTPNYSNPNPQQQRVNSQTKVNGKAKDVDSN